MSHRSVPMSLCHTPSHKIRPEVMSVIPSKTFKSVVLPPPEGPKMETISPLPISKLMSFKTVFSLYCFFDVLKHNHCSYTPVL